MLTHPQSKKTQASTSYHYQIGDVVWYLHETRKVGVNPKFEKAYDGPYPLTAKLSEINFTTQYN
ncbi:hypothetical protein DPMN_143855 [Dreissena polymorpha]|uniref:Uncharacterized protein n=1 Tax=Dreissena polymorpha TaxID=45954 RepID=A0A9D4GEI2_DREPO|nr:hypothetical protein DPMN_143855 [Dreissena polymorpha]